jgi:hypothetical protein
MNSPTLLGSLSLVSGNLRYWIVSWRALSTINIVLKSHATPNLQGQRLPLQLSARSVLFRRSIECQYEMLHLQALDMPKADTIIMSFR